MKCTLCGFEFDEQDSQAVCSSCHSAKGCGSVQVQANDLIRCPNCDFTLVRAPKWFGNFFRKKQRQVWQAEERSGKPVLPLHKLEVNKKVKVSYLQTQDRSALQKIVAMGALPETELMLIQKFPSYVIQIGRGQFCIDRELASHIYVENNISSRNADGICITSP